ncbi:RNA polymerase sigma factor [Candidatus Campbellbacteria bacterium]|nr:MAG: RNA polymerase sigma factor [Candidatus Campbellbacteria bacterium]
MGAPLTGYNSLADALAKAQLGHEIAFRAIYEHLVDRIFSFVRPRARSRDEATDIVQDIFVDVWGAMPRFTYISDAHFYSFVFTIAKRRLIRHYKTHTHESLDDFEQYELPRIEADIVDPDGMQKLVNQLSEKYREVVTLRYFSGLSFAEIGDLLGTTETNAKVRHHRALKELRELMQKYE